MKQPTDPTDQDLIAQLLKSRLLRDAPEHVIQRVIDLFPGWVGAPAQPSALQRVWAALSFDSAGVWLPALGIRNAASGSRQLLFTAEGRDIDLRIVAAEGGANHLDAGQWVIFGQLLGPDWFGRVDLQYADGLQQAVLDEMLEFRFDQVPSGSMRLTLHLEQLVIELPPFDVPRSNLP